MLTVAAARTTGGRRLTWGAGAAVTWLAAAVNCTVGTALTQLARSAGDPPRTPAGP